VSDPLRQWILVRHAHADWPSFSGRDFDRPLTPRGLDDARASACTLRDAGLRPELVVASPALRTRQTAEILCTELQLSPQALCFPDALYNAGPALLEAELRKLQGDCRLVMVVAHNPGISELARRLSKDPLAPPFAPAQWRVLSPNQ
jgi:phosphohistidine phosphatase